ncbi:some similarities with Saccharomyces cerevisiae YJL129C TRK1 Component of the Trk1p-Trk2p potassium transport system [Maudiozyma barnettii]|uniref:Some similarities with Saccharomyces cerevisiae YJL129C TRK1 Component of the Trk1p-Trk2p potassium transport system n=1 Tax=Maudiozyma barnettii TaxID=61262 RepID=A0A8H2ZIN1_9SACH|nr:Trk1p [Kazachstania barnettii]CAB4255138.1 some similarities with Saccharomyces cerevisiae YJL129C TRK1 Component of the Trk1p-Trk2p potassium transport system [Kazachstania barnettii]CAD1783409.1 some similarities with Saccharomyces cerevisiae YJL129C TRK1 Component of the Trk1p-Trk2p potassium transport system [Kazachstania barnettii]
MHIPQRIHPLRRTLTRVSTLAPNFTIPESYKKSAGHRIRDIIAKIGTWIEPLKKYLFPNFLAVHYIYIITMTIITSILLYPVKNAKYIDILFLATGASTQGGLNTIDVNSLTLYQQIIVYITCCLTTPIAIHGFLAFVRLYWFERYFDGISDFSKKDFKMRRTKTILQRELTRRTLTTPRQPSMRFDSIGRQGHEGNRNMDESYEMRVRPTITFRDDDLDLNNKTKNNDNSGSNDNISGVKNGTSSNLSSQVESSKRTLAIPNDNATITSSDTTKHDNSKENSTDVTSHKKGEGNNNTTLSGQTTTPDTNHNNTKRESSNSKNFQEKLFSGQMVNRDEDYISEEAPSDSQSNVSKPKQDLQRAKTPILVDDDISPEPRKSNAYSDSKRHLEGQNEENNIKKSSSTLNMQSEKERFAKRRNSAEITPQDMLRSLQMLRDQHEETEENDGPALVIQAPNENKNQKNIPKPKTINPNGLNSEASRLNWNTSHKRSESGDSKRPRVTPQSINLHPQERLPSGANNIKTDELQIRGLNSDAHQSSILSSDVNDSINSGNAADINDDNTSDESNHSMEMGDSFAISDNSISDSGSQPTDSEIESETLSNRDNISPREESSINSIPSQPINESPFSLVKTQSTTEVVAQNHQDLDEKVTMHPITGDFEEKPTVTFGPEPAQHRQTIHFDIQQPPRRHLVKMESTQEAPTWASNRPPFRRAPSTSKYLLKQLRKGKRFRKNLKRRLSSGSFDKDQKDDILRKKDYPNKSNSHNQGQHMAEDYFADNETDEEKEHYPLPNNSKPSMNKMLAHSLTFDVNDGAKLNELAQEPDFQKMVYKQWKKEHKNKHHLRSPRKMGERYIAQRRKNNTDGSAGVQKFRTETTHPAIMKQTTQDDSVSFTSAASLPDLASTIYKNSSPSGLPHLLYESTGNSNKHPNDLYRPNSRFTTDGTSHDDGYDNDADDDNNEGDDDDDYDRNYEDNDSQQSYYGFHPDDNLSPNFIEQVHPLSKTMSSNYLSWQPTVSRNSNFTGLTNIQKNELGGVEYRAIKLLCRILIVYYVGFHILCFVIMLPWICRDSKYAHIVREAGVSPAWWGFFTSMSAFNDLGLTLTPDSMGSFNTAVYPLVVMIWFIIIGNTGFPILLRFIIWIMFKISPELSHIRESSGFLLDHPRRCFTLLFPESATWWLLLTLVVLNFTDFILFIILDLGSTVLKPISKGYRVLDGLFQAVSTRTAGFGVVDLSQLNAATQVSYMLMMYVSVLPLAISIRRTNVYEEQSLGLYGEVESESEGEESADEEEEEEGSDEDENEDENENDDDDDDDDDDDKIYNSDIAERSNHSLEDTIEGSSQSNKSSTLSHRSSQNNKRKKKKKKKSKKKKRKRGSGEPESEHMSTKSFIGQHLRKQLSFDLWFVFLGLFIICICENDKIKDQTMPNFNVFSILFEVVSAYGTVGLSLGYPTTNQSFSARFTTLSKLVIICMLIRGRNRGLPYSLDRAIILPSERLEHIDHIEDLKLRRRKDHLENVDPLTGLFRKSMKRFTKRVEETPIYRTFTQDFNHQESSYQHNSNQYYPHQQQHHQHQHQHQHQTQYQRYQPQNDDYFTEEGEEFYNNNDTRGNSYESSLRTTTSNSGPLNDVQALDTEESLRDRQQRIDNVMV